MAIGWGVGLPSEVPNGLPRIVIPTGAPKERSGGTCGFCGLASSGAGCPITAGQVPDDKPVAEYSPEQHSHGQGESRGVGTGSADQYSDKQGRQHAGQIAGEV